MGKRNKETRYFKDCGLHWGLKYLGRPGMKRRVRISRGGRGAKSEGGRGQHRRHQSTRPLHSRSYFSAFIESSWTGGTVPLGAPTSQWAKPEASPDLDHASLSRSRRFRLRGVVFISRNQGLLSTPRPDLMEFNSSFRSGPRLFIMLVLLIR
jgi:hypothetical protein